MRVRIIKPFYHSGQHLTLYGGQNLGWQKLDILRTGFTHDHITNRILDDILSSFTDTITVPKIITILGWLGILP